MTHKLVPIEPSNEMIDEAMAMGRWGVHMVERVRSALRAAISAAPKPSIPADDREEVARAIKDRLFHGLEPFGARKPENSIVELQLADAAISTLQRLGWKPGKEE